MRGKFDVRLVYAAIAVLVIWLLVLGWKSADTLLAPVPQRIDATERNATIHFEEDRSTVVFNTDCVGLSWQTENIQAVKLNNKGMIGQGTASRCGDELRLSVTFVDGTRKDYQLSRDVIFDVSNSLITLVLSCLVVYIVCAYTLVPKAEQAVSRKEIRPLTSYRGLAALFVFFYHWPIPAATLLYALQKEGLIGVTLFFVLSGFLITNRYIDEIINRVFRWRVYLVRRAARILPLYYVVFIIVALWHEPFNLANLTLTQAYFPKLWTTGIPPAWTLTLEESFYLLLPLILWLCWRSKRPWWILSATVVLLYAVGSLLVTTGIWSLSFMLMHTIFGRMIDFAVGVGCALIYRHWRPGKRAWVLTLVCAIGFLIWGLILSASAISSVGDWGAAVLAGGLILSLTSDYGWVVRLMSWPLLVYAGRVSYAFYLFHYTKPTMELRNTLSTQFGNATPLVLLMIVVVICIGLYELVEKPAHNGIIRRFHATGSPKAASLQSVSGTEGSEK